MIFTPEQIEEILKIVDYTTTRFIAFNLGSKFLSPVEKEVLESYGIKIPTKSTVEEAFRFGIVAAALNDDRAKSLSYDEFKKFLYKKDWLPLDSREKEALKSLEYQAYSEIKGLGNVIRRDLGRTLIEADKRQRERFEKIIHDKAQETIIKRESIKFLASEIGHKTQDWTRDLHRIADYILHDAHDNGIASEIARQYGDDAKVYKWVLDKACAVCVELYLTDGEGSAPRIFNLADLYKNGSNIGRKAADMLPVIGPTHPWCRCQLMVVPPNSVWDEKKQQFVITFRSERAKMFAQKIKDLGLIRQIK